MASVYYTWKYRYCLCLIEEVLLHSPLKICSFKATVLLEVQIKAWIISSLCTDQTLNVRKRQVYGFCRFPPHPPVLHDAKINIA